MSFDAYTNSGQGQNLFQQLCVQSIRDPVSGVDLNDPGGGPYQIGRRWFNKVNDNYWRYQGQGIWILDSSGTGPLLKLGVPAGISPIVPDTAGLISFTSTGGTVTISGSAGGLNAQNINFDVSGGSVVGSFPVDAATAPGTNPVVPTGNQVTIEGGATYATGTRAKPIRTNSLAASTIDLEIQLAGGNSAVSTPNNFGVSQFDSNQFSVTSGFIQLKGGGVNPALTKLAVQAGTTPVVPDATGQITFNGARVAAGTNPVRTDGTGANTVALEVQTAQAISSTDATKVGLASFSSTDFSVDANGFVTLSASGSFNNIVRQVFTSSGTYTPTSGMTFCDIEVVGGGGGGAGSANTAGGTASAGAGGGGGGYAKKLVNAATVGASKSVTIGAAGSGGGGGTTVGSNGGSGGTTSVGSIVSATGGTGGIGGPAGASNAIAAAFSIGGVGSSGDVNVYGTVGEAGLIWGGSLAIGGNGGGSFYGSGAAASGNGGPTNVSYSFGSGGSGASSFGGQTGNTGTPGQKGIVVITEYIT